MSIQRFLTISFGVVLMALLVIGAFVLSFVILNIVEKGRWD